MSFSAKLTGALCALAVVAACASGQVTTRKSFLTACSAYAGTLNTLAQARKAGKLSEQEVAVVNRLRKTVNPICNSDFNRLKNPRDAIETVEDAIFRLRTVEAN